jgi:cyclopropane fatty-acyl-phospholipid synthase-like methyltransferase
MKRGEMNRSDWIKTRRRETEERYDTLWAAEYSEKWGTYSNVTHLKFIEKFLDFLPPHSRILDAACGAGRYMPLLLERGYDVLGIDQAQGMLASAQAKIPAAQTEKVGLQEMAYREVFEGAICMDAMEHVSPEDWPLVLGNLQRALKSQGYLYFTVEIPGPDEMDEIEEAFKQGQEQELPIVHGECITTDVYHYYPSMEQVREWIQKAGLTAIEEGEGDGYHHFLTRKA